MAGKASQHAHVTTLSRAYPPLWPPSINFLLGTQAAKRNPWENINKQPIGYVIASITLQISK
jgi:hypothetical protein